jgi:hypothetical protein
MDALCRSSGGPCGATGSSYLTTGFPAAYERANNPIELETGLVQRVINADLIRSERTATLQNKHNLTFRAIAKGRDRVSSLQRFRHRRFVNDLSHLNPGEPILASLAPIRLGPVVGHLDRGDPLGILEAELGRRAEAVGKSERVGDRLLGVFGSEDCLRMQRDGHVETRDMSAPGDLAGKSIPVPDRSRRKRRAARSAPDRSP